MLTSTDCDFCSGVGTNFGRVVLLVCLWAVCDESGVVPYLRFLGSFQVRPAFAGLGFALFYGEAH